MSTVPSHQRVDKRRVGRRVPRSLLEAGLFELTVPDKPRSSRQRQPDDAVPGLRCASSPRSISPAEATCRQRLRNPAGADWWIWKRTQDEGKRLRELDRQERRRVFKHGELPNAHGPSKGFVGIEADATKIHAYKAKGENHDLYMGLAYDGKERMGKNRNRLTNKIAVCGIYSTKEFREDLFVAAQKYHNVVDATAMLFSSDGERALENLRRNHFPQAEHQLDWLHVADRVISGDAINTVRHVICSDFCFLRCSYCAASIDSGP